MLSLIIPVYNNRDSLPRLLEEVAALSARLSADVELVFIVDGATDGSLSYLREQLPSFGESSRLLELSRNFGSFAAIMAGRRGKRRRDGRDVR